MSTADSNCRWSWVLIRTMVQCGVRHIVISSGSRSTPLVLAASHCDDVRLWTHPDERAAAFYALGIGKATCGPAVLICTSGTAAANYYPAVIEAHYSHTPLIVLSADRPPRLRGTGAPQTIDQVNLYARYPRHFADLPCPCETGEEESWRKHAQTAFEFSVGPVPGPVHLNVPFDEPLLPEPAIAERLFASWKGELFHTSEPKIAPVRTSPSTDWEAAHDLLRRAQRPLIVCGPRNERDGLSSLLAPHATGVPVLADIASQLRGAAGTGIISHYDLYLHEPKVAERLRPDAVVRFGTLPTSRVLNEWLAGGPPLQIAISRHGEPADPYGTVSHHLVGDAPGAMTRLFDSRTMTDRKSGYVEQWRLLESETAGVLTQMQLTGKSDAFEGDIVAAAVIQSPAAASIYLANSLPIRFADVYVGAAAAGRRVLVNRGANGIDGLVSSAAGSAIGSDGPVVLVIGDIAFFHDLTALWIVAAQQLPLKIVLINNDGGGIFSFLSVREHERIFNPLVAMPHGRDFADIARWYGILYHRAVTLADFEAAYAGVAAASGPAIIEVPADRRRTVAIHRERIRQVCERVGDRS